MEWYWAGIVLLGCVVCGIALGFPVAFTFLITNIIGTSVFVIRDHSSLAGFVGEAYSKLPQIVDNAPQLITTFTLSPIPMFILMGSLFFHTGIAVRVFDALDKLLGWALLEDRLPLHEHVVMVSGRTSYEILQKSLMAEVPVVCAVSAPSSLAVALARRFGITLVGFLRGRRFNVYAGVERVLTGEKSSAP